MNTMRLVWTALSVLGFACVLVSASAAQVTVDGQIVSVDGTSLRGDVTLVRGGSAVQFRHYHADGQGAFSLETDRSAGQLLVVKADGHTSAEAELDTRHSHLNVRFRLWPAGRASGRVVDEAGNGVAGATVHVRYPGELRRHHFHHEVGDIEADDFGYFTLPVVARGRRFMVEAATPRASSRDDRSPEAGGRGRPVHSSHPWEVGTGGARHGFGFGGQPANGGQGSPATVCGAGGGCRRTGFEASRTPSQPADRHEGGRRLRVHGPAGRNGGRDRAQAGQAARHTGTSPAGAWGSGGGSHNRSHHRLTV